MTDSFKSRTTLKVGAQQYDILSLAALKSQNVDRLPFSLKYCSRICCVSRTVST
jgi:hypothetical protein